jgi:hypothetical protein
MRHITISMLACALIATAAFAEDTATDQTTNPTEKPDATLNLTGGSIAVGIGYVWGGGALLYKGEKHPFKLSGVSIVDVGGAHITATGDVYHLQNLEDFNGDFTSVSAGLTVAGGGSVAILRNDHGVVIKLRATTEGLRFNFAAEGVHIKLKT